jgi:prepilin-type N-terminal cleavage/methylation domain-containing protein/prepilin-type processing-associated H-X9-DG protein
MKKTQNQRLSLKGFTLIEFLVVVSLIAVLAGLLFPVVNKMRAAGERTKAANNLRQLCLAYQLALEDKPNGFEKSATPQSIIEDLAIAGDIREASLFFISSDPQVTGKTLPKAVFQATGALSENFTDTLVGYEFAQGVPPSAPSTTPIIWTKGLKEDGTWEANSPYLGKGGHVGYLDGHVEWYAETKDRFFHYKARTQTSNYKDALPRDP